MAFQQARALAPHDREQPARDRRRGPPEGPERARSGAKRFLNRVLGVFRRAADVQTVPVDALAVCADQAIESREVAGLGPNEIYVRQVGGHAFDRVFAEPKGFATFAALKSPRWRAKVQ